MADEPRRSGRATKGQHTKTASSSPAPQPKLPKKESGKKASKKSQPEQASLVNDYDEEDDEKIRCICGDDNPKDKRAFIECEACQVWQHNVCMGMPDDDDDLPDHYFCEECSPEEHGETLAALAAGDKIWETRNRIYQNEKKGGPKRKGKTGRPGWLKKDAHGQSEADQAAADSLEPAGNKRKRGEAQESVPEPEIKSESEEKNARGARQDKKRKAGANGHGAAADPETSLVDIDKLPTDRQRTAVALSKIISEDIDSRSEAAAYRIPEGRTAQSLGDYHAARIEYALKMNHGGPQNPPYAAQFRTLHANLKKNKVLIARLLDGTLTADELSTMESKDMASEELQKQNALLKEQADRQAVAVQEEGPRYRRTHKGDELIEDENAMAAESARAQPVRERTILAEDGSTTTEPQGVARSPVDSTFAEEPRRSMGQTQGHPEPRRTSSQQFDMDDIWAKTAQSPTSATATRPLQMPPRRRSSIKAQPQDPSGAGGTKEDADVDRMLQDDDDDDDDDTYSPADYTDGSPSSGTVWRGKLLQSADGVSPTVNARFVAGRDLTPTVSWRDLLPSQLSIDGRLQIARAEEYLCSLQWSQTSDVSVLALTPHDDADAFEAVFKYFKSRERYAVVNKDKPPMVKDLYIIPVDEGQELPSHVGMLEFNRLGTVIGQKCLLASLVVGRSVESPSVLTASAQQSAAASGIAIVTNGQQQNLPQHMRAAPGPAGSPLNANNATFSPPTMTGDGVASFPPNPYGGQPPQSPNPLMNPLVAEILGGLQSTPTAQQVVLADPNIAREKLMHLKEILENDPLARTDITALAARLYS